MSYNLGRIDKQSLFIQPDHNNKRSLIMIRILVAATFLLVGYEAYADEAYDPIYASSPQAPLATKAALVGFDQLSDKYVATGVFGTVLIKQGQSDWQQMKVPTSVLLTSVSMVDEHYIWAAGHDGVLLQSTDGGQSWVRKLDGFALLEMEHPWLKARMAALEERIEQADDEEDIEEYEFALEELGFLMEGLDIQFAVGPTKPFLDLVFLDRSVGFALAAYGTLLKTTDGGESWQILSDRVNNPSGFHLNKLLVGENNTLFLLGEYGLLKRSTDLGESWHELDSPYDGSFFGGFISPKGDLWVFGLRGNLFKSVDQGESFSSIPLATSYNLNSSTILADGRFVLVGQSGVIVVIDDSASAETTEVYTHESGVPLMGVRQENGNKLILVGRSGLQSFVIPQATTGRKG